MLLIMLTLAEIVSFLSLLSSGKTLGKTECWSKLLGQNYGENARLDPEGKNIVVALFLLIYQSPSGEKAQSFAFFFVFLSPSPLHPTFPKKSLRTWWVIRDCGAFLSWQLMEWKKWMISSSGPKDEVFLTVGLHFYLCSCSSSSVQGRIEGSFVLLIPWIWDHIYMQMYHLVHNWRENITAMSTWYISTVRPDAKSAKELKGFPGAFFIVCFL